MKLPKIYASEENNAAIDLTLSTNPLGCSPLVVKALKTLTVATISSYPDTADFVRLLAKRFSITAGNIVLGTGSEQLIKLIAQIFIKSNNQALVEKGSFAIFSKECLLVGAQVKQVSMDEMLNASKPKLVFIANPKTPTGELIEISFLKKLVRKLAPAIIVVDEANGEFTDETLVTDIGKSDNLIVLRTFSKVFGLAGLRIGAAVGPEKIIKKLKAAQQPFPVSHTALMAAQAALSDTAFIKRTKQFVAAERAFLRQKLKELGLETSDSVTNNLFIKVANTPHVVDELAKRGVAVIDGSFFPGMETPGIRISLKDRETNRLFLIKLGEVLKIP